MAAPPEESAAPRPLLPCLSFPFVHRIVCVLLVVLPSKGGTHRAGGGEEGDGVVGGGVFYTPPAGVLQLEGEVAHPLRGFYTPSRGLHTW